MSHFEQILEDAYAATSELPAVQMFYINWKGVPKVVTVKPRKWFFGSTQWHPTPQYLMEAWDVEKGEMRVYAMEGIKGWMPQP